MIFTVITDQHSAVISVQAVDDIEYSLIHSDVTSIFKAG